MNVSIKYTLIVIIFSIILINNYKCNGLSKPRENRNWRDPNVAIGKLVGISISKSNELYISHRAYRVGWPTNEGKILDNTITVIDASNSKFIKSWGNDTFVLPHGITVDHNNNVWVTDIGRHQVMRFDNNSIVPNLIIGEEMISGNDSYHFCEPMQLTVSTSNVVFIADGYCNTRIIAFTYSGKYLREIPIPNGNRIHSIALVEEKDMVCVSDRENHRILCYYAGLKDLTRFGKLIFSLENLAQVMAINHIGDTLYAVTANATNYLNHCGISIDLKTKNIKDIWRPENEIFDVPHSMAVSPDGRTLFIAETWPNVKRKIFKFDIPEN